MFDYEKIHRELESYLHVHSDEYDIPAIMDALRDYKPGNGDCIASIDDVHPDDFFEILMQHEK